MNTIIDIVTINAFCVYIFQINMIKYNISTTVLKQTTKH